MKFSFTSSVSYCKNVVYMYSALEYILCFIFFPSDERLCHCAGVTQPICASLFTPGSPTLPLAPVCLCQSSLGALASYWEVAGNGEAS